MTRIVGCCIAAALVFGSSLAVAGAADGPYVAGFVLVALNPQPEPPGAAMRRKPHAGNVVTDWAVVRGGVALNPQPEPPGVTDVRKLLPPGPCRDFLVSVRLPGAAAVSTRAEATAVPGKCRWELHLPSSRGQLPPRVAMTFSFSQWQPSPAPT